MGHDKTRLNPLASGVRTHTTANRPQWQNPAKSRADSETMWSGDNRMYRLAGGRSAGASFAAKALAELDQSGESQISLTDPDSRVMAAHTHVAVGDNVQVAVDAKHKLIIEQQGAIRRSW